MSRAGLTLASLAMSGFAAGMMWSRSERQRKLFSPTPWPKNDREILPRALRQEFIVPTPDGESLQAWHLESEGEFDPILIWFHGAGGNLTDRVPIADRLRRKGISVFLFDWRGYGRSTGKPTVDGLMTDAVAAREFVGRHFPSSRPIVLYGESLGGPLAAWAAAKRPCSGVIVENSFPSLAALANVLYSPFPVGLFDPLSLRTLDWLNDAGVPVLVIHGQRDETVPVGLGVRLYNGLETPRALLISDSARHNEVGLIDIDRYDSAVLDFIGAVTVGQPDLFGIDD